MRRFQDRGRTHGTSTYPRVTIERPRPAPQMLTRKGEWRGDGRRSAVSFETSSRNSTAELETRPYAFLANPTTEIIILADILANVRMQFYLLLSWETR